MTLFKRDLFKNWKINSELSENLRNDLFEARDLFGDLFGDLLLDLFKNEFSKEIFSESPKSILNFSESPKSILNFSETSKTIFLRIRTFPKILLKLFFGSCIFFSFSTCPYHYNAQNNGQVVLSILFLGLFASRKSIYFE